MAGERKELKFYGGGFEEIIRNGVKLGTMRPARRYDFIPGEEVTAICEGEGEVPIVIFRTQDRRIIDTPQPLLLLDGFTSPKVATERMRDFYPETREKTIMGLTTFIARDIYASYDDNTRTLLTRLSQEEAIKTPELRKVFFPSLAWWTAWNGGGFSEWLKLVEEAELVPREELDEWKEFNGKRVMEVLSRTNYEFLMKGVEKGWSRGVLFEKK